MPVIGIHVIWFRDVSGYVQGEEGVAEVCQ